MRTSNVYRNSSNEESPRQMRCSILHYELAVNRTGNLYHTTSQSLTSDPGSKVGVKDQCTITTWNWKTLNLQRKCSVESKFKMSVFPAMSSQFSFENEISIVTRMDAPISKGPMARWQRKALEANSISNSSLNQSASTKLNSISCGFANLSLPFGGANSSLVAGAKRISEATRKTPSKTPKN